MPDPVHDYDLSDPMRDALQMLAVDELVRLPWGNWVPLRRREDFDPYALENTGMSPGEDAVGVTTLRALDRRGLVHLPDNDTQNGALCTLTPEGQRVAWGLQHPPGR